LWSGFPAKKDTGTLILNFVETGVPQQESDHPDDTLHCGPGRPKKFWQLVGMEAQDGEEDRQLPWGMNQNKLAKSSRSVCCDFHLAHLVDLHFGIG
jgi:hypothetical protein